MNSMGMADSDEKQDTTSLKYAIHKFSSYSAPYVPENILEDKPDDQSSRWSSESNSPPQFLILKLDRPAIVNSISFGKYEKIHVCNLKKFRVYGGLTEDNMVLLLESGLKNDTVPETFLLERPVKKHDFPVRFIKIMPLESWGSTHTFNFSVWRVTLEGCEEWSRVQQCIHWYTLYREKEAIRLCLKHFRQHNNNEVFNLLSSCSKVQLEDPLLTRLHDYMVRIGDFEKCEQIIEDAAQDGLFRHYITQQDYKPQWTPILPPPGSAGGKERPGMRGGHQMCIDTNTQTIYLFGGWDGNMDLSDLWAYHLPSEEWTCISSNTANEGGPTARSCHKMCLDPERRQIFTLGRYLDSTLREPPNLKSDFYMYDINSNKWTLITEDTASLGGPRLVFDHQMVMDIENRVIYVFGGRVLTSSRWEGCVSGLEIEGGNANQRSSYAPNDTLFSGLYSYHVSTNTWKKLRDDCRCACNPKSNEIRSRIGHSMLFHSGNRHLYILAGQRNKEYLTDFFTYSIDDDTITMISDGSRKDASSVPAAGFTQKATIDPQLNEIHVLSGLSKDKEKRDDNVRNSFWVYDITQNKWSCIYHNDQSSANYWNKMQHAEPCPRFAHQLVYDEVRKFHYLFGGNPGRHSLPKMRLDDFWSLKLSRISTEQLVHLCRFMIRKHKFSELAREDSVKALAYLQTSLHAAIDHNEPSEVEEFQALAATLFRVPDKTQTFLPFFHSPSTTSVDIAQDQSMMSFPEASTSSSDSSSLNIESTSPSTSTNTRVLERNSPQPQYGDSLNLEPHELESWKHSRRSALFDCLSRYFPETMTQPKSNLVDLIPF